MGSVAASPPKAKRATRIPEKWPLSESAGESLWSWAMENAPGVPIKVETDQWLDFHRAKGDTASDWTASWRTWMRRAQKYTDDRPARPGPRALPSGLSTTDLRVADGLALVAHYREQEGA